MKKYISLAVMLSLLSGRRYSAPALAEKYETSVKTIYRSIESLIEAGVPIVSLPGKSGGYELVKESLVDSSFFTTNELALFFGMLKSSPNCFSYESSSLDDRLSQIKDKALASQIFKESGELVIDTDAWGSTKGTSSMVNEIKQAIADYKKLEIRYNNDALKRVIEPYTLVYKAGAWYVYAYCLRRQGFRLFKLTRIEKLSILNENFERRKINTLSKPWNEEFFNNLEPIDIELECNGSYEEILEWLSDAKVEDRKDVKIIHAKAHFSLGLVHRLMELGDKVKVNSPKKLVFAIIDECKRISNIYA